MNCSDCPRDQAGAGLPVVPLPQRGQNMHACPPKPSKRNLQGERLIMLASEN